MEQKNKKLVTCYSSLVTDSKGFTLIELAIILVVIGILIALGAGLVGILTKQAKLRESREIVKAAREAVIGYAVKNKRLPTVAEFFQIVRDKDAWGNNLFPYPDPSLISGDICCSPATGFQVNDRGTLKTDVAFIVFSLGENGTNNTGTTPPFTIQEYSDTYDDIVQYISLSELREALACSSIEIKTTNLPEGIEDTTYTAQLQGFGGCLPYSWSPNGPIGSSGLSHNNGIISGTLNFNPSAPTGRLASCTEIIGPFTITLTDAQGKSTSKDFSILVFPQTLRITNTDIPSVTEGAIISNLATLIGAGGKNSYTWSLAGNPSWLTVNGSTGVLSVNNPTPAGDYPFTAILNDTCSTTSKSFSIRVNSGGGGGGCPALSLNPASGTSWSINVGDSLNQTITVSGGQSPYTNTQCTPATCNGLSLSCTNNNATISGTASAPGTCTFDIAWQDSCTNPGPQTISGTYTVNIGAPSCDPFTGWSSNLPVTDNCQSYSGSITVLGGLPAYTWALTSGSLPNGINFCTGNTSSTCNLTGAQVFAPPQTYNFTVQVTDSCTNPGPQSKSQGFSITVADSCYAGGISLRNQSGATRYYRKNGGACTSWATTAAASISVLPADSYSIYSNNTCTTLYCANPVTYCQQKPYDANGNCQTRMNAGCVFADR